MTDHTTLRWKDHWDRTRQRFAAWWRGAGLVLHVTAPAETPRLPDAIRDPILQGSSGVDFTIRLPGGGD